VELILPALPASYAAFTKVLAGQPRQLGLVLIEKHKEDPAPDFAHARVRFQLGANQDDGRLAIVPAQRMQFVRRVTWTGSGWKREGDLLTQGSRRHLAAFESATKADGEWSLFFRLSQATRRCR